jgi:sn-glycerol 3-phosphate transport system substrate-binding protein
LAYQTKDTANACDINVGLTSTIPSMLELDWTVKASDMYDKYDAYVSQDSFPVSLIESVSYQDEMIALPFLNSTMLLYYNADALAEAGFDAPPATLDELISYTEALTTKDGSNISRYGFECAVKRYQLVNYICEQSTDAYFGDLESGRAGAMTKITAGDDGTLKAFLEKWDALVETGGYQYVEDNVSEEFSSQTTAMAMFSSSKCTSVNGLVGDSFQWEVTAIPKVNASDNGSSAVGGSCLVLFDRGDEARLAGAWDFMQYLSTADSQYRIATTSGYIPTNKDTADLPEMQAFWEEHPQYKVAFDIIMNAASNAQEPMDLAYNEINTVITDTMRQFCDRELTVDQAVDAIVSGSNKLLDEWHEANG